MSITVWLSKRENAWLHAGLAAVPPLEPTKYGGDAPGELPQLRLCAHGVKNANPRRSIKGSRVALEED